LPTVSDVIADKIISEFSKLAVIPRYEVTTFFVSSDYSLLERCAFFTRFVDCHSLVVPFFEYNAVRRCHNLSGLVTTGFGPILIVPFTT